MKKIVLCALFSVLSAALFAQKYTQQQKDSIQESARISIENARRNPLVVPSLPKLSDKISEDIKSRKSHGILTNSANISDAAFVKYNGTVFTIAWRGENVIYIGTNDGNFKTDNLSVSTTYEKFKILFPGKLKREPGWGYFYELPSGWNVAFCAGQSCSEALTNDLKITSFFKRTW